MNDNDLIGLIVCGLLILWIGGSTCRFNCHHKPDEECPR